MEQIIIPQKFRISNIRQSIKNKSLCYQLYTDYLSSFLTVLNGLPDFEITFKKFRIPKGKMSIYPYDKSIKELDTNSPFDVFILRDDDLLSKPEYEGLFKEGLNCKKVSVRNKYITNKLCRDYANEHKIVGIQKYRIVYKTDPSSILTPERYPSPQKYEALARFLYKKGTDLKNTVTHQQLGSAANFISYLERVQETTKHPNSFGFAKNRSIHQVATIHSNSSTIISFDIRDFFHSFTESRIRSFFNSKLGSGVKLDKFIKLTTIEDKEVSEERFMCQGSPISPLFTNILSWDLDNDLLSYANQNNAKYTRYADDLTFSFTTPYPTDFVENVLNICSKHNFHVNTEKIEIQPAIKDKKVQRQTVLGCVVNVKPNVKKEYKQVLKRHLNSFFTVMSRLPFVYSQLWINPASGAKEIANSLKLSLSDTPSGYEANLELFKKHIQILSKELNLPKNLTLFEFLKKASRKVFGKYNFYVSLNPGAAHSLLRSYVGRLRYFSYSATSTRSLSCIHELYLTRLQINFNYTSISTMRHYQSHVSEVSHQQISRILSQLQ